MTQMSVGTICLAAILIAISPAPQGGSLILDAVVERANASFVEGLTAGDFVVTAGGAELQIVECVVDDGPVSVVVMIDLSLSSRWPGLGENPRIERPLADNLLAQLRGNDRVRFASIGRNVAMSEGFTADPSRARTFLRDVLALGDEERSGPSPIWDALDDAISALEAEPSRRAVILITDGKATANRKDIADVASRAVALGIPISTVRVGLGTFLVNQGTSQAAVVSPGLALARVSDATGGLALVMSHGTALPSPLTTVARALRRAYRLTVSVGPGVSRTDIVTIRVRDGRYAVRSWKSSAPSLRAQPRTAALVR